MDLSGYLKKSKASHSRFGVDRQKFCLECGRELVNDGSLQYRRCFCSEECMNAYINSGKQC